jgi:N-acetylglucosamine malate deacetylase 2
VGERDRELLSRVAAASGSSLPLPRMLAVFAHPDDEVIALGGRLERFAASHLVTVTDGAPQDGADAREHGFPDLAAYRRAREQELNAALAHADLPPSVVLPFPERVPDQEASLHLAQLARAVAELIQTLRPEVVLTHPYEGGHPDHEACAFAAHTAVALCEAEATTTPLLVEAPFYNIGENGGMRTGHFLTADQLTFDCELSATEQRNKRARLACFVSQQSTLAQFGVEREAFRIAPHYDFTVRPHTGRLLYESFAWGMSGDRFCNLSSAALQELLGLQEVAGCRDTRTTSAR